MIAKSDIVILTLASAVLGIGLLRAQQNSQNIDFQTVGTGSVHSTSSPAVPNIAKVQKHNNSTTEVPDNFEETGIVTLTSDGSIPSITAATENVAEGLPSGLQGATVIVEASGQANSFSAVENTTTDNQDSVLLMVHAVKKGEYLSLLAKRYGTTTEQLTQLNGLTTTTLQIGQEIVYPSAQ